MLWVSDPACDADAKTAVQHFRRVLTQAGLKTLHATQAIDVREALRDGQLDLRGLLAAQECVLIIFDGDHQLGSDTAQVVDDARGLGLPVVLVQPSDAPLTKAQAVKRLSEATAAGERVFHYEPDAVGEAVEAALLHATQQPRPAGSTATRVAREFPKR